MTRRPQYETIPTKITRSVRDDNSQPCGSAVDADVRIIPSWTCHDVSDFFSGHCGWNVIVNIILDIRIDRNVVYSPHSLLIMLILSLLLLSTTHVQ